LVFASYFQQSLCLKILFYRRQKMLLTSKTNSVQWSLQLQHCNGGLQYGISPYGLNFNLNYARKIAVISKIMIEVCLQFSIKKRVIKIKYTEISVLSLHWSLSIAIGWPVMNEIAWIGFRRSSGPQGVVIPRNMQNQIDLWYADWLTAA